MSSFQRPLLYLILAVICIGCSQESKVSNTSPSKITATPLQNILKTKDVLEKFKTSKISLISEIVYTEDTDTNKLLGRPNQYIEKVNWSDERLKDKNNISCTVEIFANENDCEARKSILRQSLNQGRCLCNTYINIKMYLCVSLTNLLLHRPKNMRMR
jgi:hypothetical protein